MCLSFFTQVHGDDVNLDALFDVQIKRIHEYKRQHLNIFSIIHRYKELKAMTPAQRKEVCCVLIACVSVCANQLLFVRSPVPTKNNWLARSLYSLCCVLNLRVCISHESHALRVVRSGFGAILFSSKPRAHHMQCPPFMADGKPTKAVFLVILAAMVEFVVLSNHLKWCLGCRVSPGAIHPKHYLKVVAYDRLPSTFVRFIKETNPILNTHVGRAPRVHLRWQGRFLIRHRQAHRASHQPSGPEAEQRSRHQGPAARVLHA